MVGTIVLNRFGIERKLGRGGFGTVYLAWDSRLEREVAVKVIEAGTVSAPRLLREAQAAARLNHPAIVTLYELGEEDGQTFLVSELVDGPTLRRLSLEGRLSDHEIAEVGADLCAALEHAHSRGVVHRDIKPQNILVTGGEPAAKLMDFGIARLLDAGTLTATGSVIGTLAYMAPEQAEGEEADTPADVFSLALTLYECWSGHNPHLRETPAATVRAIGEPPPSLHRLRPDLPEPLIDAIDAALDPDPARRPALEELGNACEEALPELDDADAAPRASDEPAGFGGVFGHSNAPTIANAAATGGLVAAAMVAVGASAPGWTLLLAPLVALVALISPRLGFLTSSLGLAVWLGAAGRSGAATVLLAITIPPFLLLRGPGRCLTLPAAAPALGAIALAPVFPAIAALAGHWRDRAVIAATGFAWLATAEVVLRRELLFGPHVLPTRGWQESVGGAFSQVLVPLATDPAFLAGLAIWALAAVVAGVLLAPVRWRVARAPGRRGSGRVARAATATAGGGRGAPLP